MKKIKAILSLIVMTLFIAINTTTALADSIKVEVLLDISAFDTKSGLNKMMLSNYENFKDGKWEDYKAEKQWELLNYKGINKVYVKVTDKYNNVSEPALATIDLGDKDLFEKIVINNGNKSSESNKIIIDLPDNDKTKEVSFSEDKTNWSDWESYGGKKEFTFKDEGEQDIYIRIKTEDGYIFTKEYKGVLTIVKPNKAMPQTGSIIDFRALSLMGIALMGMGVYVLKPKKLKKQN